MAESKPSHVQRFLVKRSKTLSESSETSIGAESLTDMEVEMPRKRLGSVPNRDELAKDAGTMNNYLYDKYLAK